MKTSQIFLSGASLAAMALLSACGGGGGQTNSAGSTPAPASPTATGTGTGTAGTDTAFGTGTGATTATPIGNTGTTTTSPTTTTTTPTYAPQLAPPAGTPYVSASQQGQRSANDDAEYRVRYATNEYVHALYAYDAGWTGKGVTIGQIDSGIDVGNPEFTGRISSLSQDFGHTITTNPDGSTSSAARSTLGDSYSTHGTATAGIMVANRNGSGLEGMAYDAQVAVFRVDDVDYTKGTDSLTSVNITAALNYAAQNKIKIINESLNVAGNYMDPRQATAIGNFGATGGLIINSSGNDGAAQPPEASMLTATQLKAVLFVGAIDTSGTGWQISSYSNRAGSAADRYVVAPGDNLVLQYGKNGAYAAGAGTSYAAPMVTALAALILQKWPQLSGQQAGNVILATAKDLGDPGVDAIYGHGLVDYQAALSPVNPTLSNGSASSSVTSSTMMASGAINSSSIASALENVTILDAFGRNFTGNLSAAVIQPDQRQRVRGLVGQNTSGQVASVGTAQVHGTVGYTYYGDAVRADEPKSGLDFARVEGQFGGIGFSMGYRANTGINAPILGLGPVSDGFAAYAPQADRTMGVSMPVMGGLRLTADAATGNLYGATASAVGFGLRGTNGGFRLGLIDETNSVLGTISSGALALGRGATTVLLEGDRTVGLSSLWQVKGYASVGMTRTDTSSASLITHVSNMIGTRFGLTLEGQTLGGLFSFGVAQPLNVENGRATLHVADGYDYDSRALTFGDQAVDLSGRRRVQLTSGFQKAWKHSSLRFGVARDVTSTGSTSGLLSYGMRF